MTRNQPYAPEPGTLSTFMRSLADECRLPEELVRRGQLLDAARDLDAGHVANLLGLPERKT